MRDPKRIPKILNALEAYWTKYPDLRLGQLVTNQAYKFNKHIDVFYIEDDIILMALEMAIENLNINSEDKNMPVETSKIVTSFNVRAVANGFLVSVDFAEQTDDGVTWETSDHVFSDTEGLQKFVAEITGKTAPEAVLLKAVA